MFMFGKRPDGRAIKSLAPLEKISPYIMKKRVDSMCMYEDYFECAPMDAYIEEKRQEGIKINYMHIIIAGVVRMMALRPALNRFVLKGRVYARPKIWISFAVHHKLVDGDVESTVKLCFDGTEGLLEIAEKIDEAIRQETVNHVEENGTDQLARLLTHIPGPLISLAVNTLMWMDRHNIMPKAVVELSPFHTSLFITNLKSLGINHIFHHIYEFGTTSLFLAMGKEKTVPVVRNGEFVAEKQMGFGLVSDERICDGLYYAKSLRHMRRLMRNPRELEAPLDQKVEDIK